MGYTIAFILGCFCGATIGAVGLSLFVAARMSKEIRL